jgi:hypothetical protein
VWLWLRAEELAVLVASVFFYRERAGSWSLFAALFLALDLSMLGYLGASRVGAAADNVAHSFILPRVLRLAGVFAKTVCALI